MMYHVPCNTTKLGLKFLFFIDGICTGQWTHCPIRPQNHATFLGFAYVNLKVFSHRQHQLIDVLSHHLLDYPVHLVCSAHKTKQKTTQFTKIFDDKNLDATKLYKKPTKNIYKIRQTMLLNCS